MQMDCDIVVAGAGLVGLTTALACGQARFRVIVIDNKSPADAGLSETFDGRASAIAQSSFNMMHTLGVNQALAGMEESHIQPISKILVSDGETGKRISGLSLFFDAADIGDSSDKRAHGYMVENRRIRKALLDLIAQHDRIEMIAPAQITEYKICPSQAKLHFADRDSLRCALVVAADGKSSFMRALAGIETTEWPCHQSAIVTTVRHEYPHNGIAHELFLPSGPFAILPLTGNRAHIVWTDTPEAARAAMALKDTAFTAELARRFGDFLGRVKPVAPHWCYPLGFTHAHSYISSRLALTGDAAHAIHPIAGQGFNMGLRDVAALVDCLVDGRSEGQDIGSGPVLENYECWRKFDNTVLVHACDFFNRLFSNTRTPLTPLRRLGLGFVDKLPPVRRFFMREAAGLTGNLPTLLRGGTC